jgi:hypothetical protein
VNSKDIICYALDLFNDQCPNRTYVALGNKGACP